MKLTNMKEVLKFKVGYHFIANVLRAIKSVKKIVVIFPVMLIPVFFYN